MNAHFRTGLVALMLTLLAGCTQPSKPNIVVVVSDALRKDHLSVYGYQRATSPRLEEFSKEARVYENAYAQSPHTWPSVASIFSSLYPREHGVILNDNVLAPEIATLAEELHSAGYFTVAAIENPVLRKERGYSQGFQDWQVEPSRMRAHYKPSELKASELLAGAQSEGKPFFLYLHLVDPHSPYSSPPMHQLFCEGERPKPAPVYPPPSDEETRQALIDCYDEEVRYLDHRFGELMDELRAKNLLEDTVVVFLSDHGEGFQERENLLHHSYGVYGELISMPFMIRWPKGLPAGRDSTPTSHVDLMPTLLDLAGVDRSHLTLSGHSLVVESGGESRPVFLEKLRTQGTPPQRGVIKGDWKLIHNIEQDTAELFQVSSDPLDQRPVTKEHPEIVETLQAELGRYLKQTRAGSAQRHQLSPEELRRLKSLGYVH